VAGRWDLAGWLVLALGAAALAGVLGGALTGSAVAARVGATLTRSGADTAAVACVGLTLVGVLLPLGAAALPTSALRDLLRVQARADRALVAAAGGWLVLLLVGTAFRAADAVGRPVTELSAADVGSWATQLAAGRGTLLAAACAAAVLGCAVARVRRRDAVPVRVPAVVAVVGTVLPALTGHAGAGADHQLAIVAIAVHGGAAALWVGGLAAVLALVARHRALLDQVLPRFSRLAAGCLVAVAVSGVLNAVVRVGGWEPLVTTGYGWLVLVKTVLLGALAGLGGLARQRLLAHRTPVLRWAAGEVAVMALAVGVAAALSQTPPPAEHGTEHGSGVEHGSGAEHGTEQGAAGHVEHADPAPPSSGLELWAAQTGPLGTVVVDGQFRVLYRFDRDSPDPPTSTCVDPACTATWAPLLTGDRPITARGFDQSALGELDRPDGSRQVTLHGWPLYLRVGESGALTGSSANGTDGAWFAISPTGDKAAPGPGG
jgi:putative copper export protein/predicted lipoprotein with Yx(FWY)xxD motif